MHGMGAKPLVTATYASCTVHQLMLFAQEEPNNRDVRTLLARYKKEAAAANKRDAKTYANLFQRMARLDAKEGKKAVPHVETPQANGTVDSHPIDIAGPSTSGAAHSAEDAQVDEAPQVNGTADDVVMQEAS